MPRLKIAILGAGPAGLMAALTLGKDHEVHIYDKERKIGQKFLVAGKGGLNITNSAPLQDLTRKYAPPGFLDSCLSRFDNLAFRQWLMERGIPTYVGTSGKVFPQKGLKARDVLQMMRDQLILQGVTFFMEHEFIAFNSLMKPVVRNEGNEITLDYSFYIFAFGGSSWPLTGSNGKWRNIFESSGIPTMPFEPSNCGIEIPWPSSIKEFHTGKPLKNISASIGEKESKGEALITREGLEGNAIYPLIPEVRRLLSSGQTCKIILDLKPFNSEDQLLAKVKNTGTAKKSLNEIFKLDPVQWALLKAFTSREDYLDSTLLVRKMKQLPIPVASLRPIEEAISTVGGVAISNLNMDFSLKKHPEIFTIGEMVDWDAPTGGFLLQACFSMGYSAAQSILKSIKNNQD